MGSTKLEGAIAFAYKKPSFFDDKIQVSATFPLKNEIVESFCAVLIALEADMKFCQMTDNNYQAVVFFINSDTLSITLIKASTQGSYLPIIIFPVHRWSSLALTEHDIMVIMMEELVHCIYRIRDEAIVKEKVTEIFQRHFPAITRSALYRRFVDPGKSISDIK